MSIFADGKFFQSGSEGGDPSVCPPINFVVFSLQRNERSEGINLKYKQNFLAKTTKLVSACSAKTIYRRQVLINFFFFWLLLLADVFLLF